MKHKYFSYMKRCLSILMLTTVLPVSAQRENISGSDVPYLITPQRYSVGYAERTFFFDVKANLDFEVSTKTPWLKVKKDDSGTVFVHVDMNTDPTSRSGIVTLKNEEKGLSRTLNVEQGPDKSAETLPADTNIKPVRANTNTYQPGQEIEKSYDDDMGTTYHSAWNVAVTPDNPAILTYEFENVDYLDYVTYKPSPGGGNGCFGEVELYVKQEGDADYRLYKSFDWGKAGLVRTVKFPGGLQKPVGIRFKVKTGANNNATCREMIFGVMADMGEDFEIFGDDIYTTLKPDVTFDDIENLESPFAKSLATTLYKGGYDTQYRVADYECYLSYMTLSDMWNAPGKYYDQLAGVTGINIPAHSKTALVASGIPDDLDVQLKVVAWYVGKIGQNFDGGNPNIMTFGLRNGVNVIDYDFDWDGLAYICYYADQDAEKYAPIKVHFVNGQVNGYLSPDKSNAEMHTLCQNAPNRCMDVVGKKVHSIWESEGLYKYCKAEDGTIGYRQYMNVLDSLIAWEHRSLGFEKYDRIPKNRTMAYVNYTYYMFQGDLGVSFHQNQQSRVLNCNNLINHDDDAIWGLSHEWGHQHQMHPYSTWAGMGEVSNNMQSYYNVMKIGYTNPGWAGSWPGAREVFINDKGYSDGNAVSDTRKGAYQSAANYAYSPKMKAVCEAMADSNIKPAATDPLHAVAYNEGGGAGTLCSIIMLHNYFAFNGKPDLMPDLYESLRQNDDPNGSQIEKKGEVDKYELIASAQNGNKNGKLAVLQQKYPESCWVKDGYITENHCGMWENSVPYIMNYIRKASRISGYNLVPYFEQWGFLRQVALKIGDYGDKYYVMTQEMYDEFKADMDALVESGELKAMPENMVNQISYSKDWIQPSPDFAN